MNIFKRLTIKLLVWWEKRKLTNSFPTNQKEHDEHWDRIQAQADEYRALNAKRSPEERDLFV